MSINQIMAKRRIDSLYHFTNVKNLPSIIEYGLIPREILEDEDIPSIFNDAYRYDRCPDAVCLSVEFPNYKMFYSLRKNQSDERWVVIQLNAQILTNFECAFCWQNAGSESSYTIPIEERMGCRAFSNLFEDREGFPTREQLEIPDNYPTNPQAEVLVFGQISPDYIKNIYFENWRDLNDYCRSNPRGGISMRINDYFFKPRKDFGFWK